MGLRGPKSHAPGGYGSITASGYCRMTDPLTGRVRMEHDLVWERANGPIPLGMCVHHRDGDRLNNAIENLELVDALTHKRIHSGCQIRDGTWWKPCRKCGVFYPVEHYYRRVDGISPWCRGCAISNATKNYLKRRWALREEKGAAIEC